MSIDAAETDFDYIRTLVRERSAIVLEAGKLYLVESRLTPLVRREGMTSLTELVSRLRRERFGGLHRKVVEAMTTNETSFFRDLHPFEALKSTILPDLIAKRKAARTLHIWCAACSSGQEPYSIAMLLHDSFPELTGWTVRILATDLSSAVLERARRGAYSQMEVNRGLPATFLVKYFERGGMEWRVSEAVRRLVSFQEMNLVESWPALPPADVVFLRNVLIYFDVDTKKNVLARARRVMRPDGYLFLGGAETTLNLDESFERVQLDKSGCYRMRLNGN